MEESRVAYMDIPETKSRSVSPMTPSPCRERNVGFFHMLTKRFARRSHDDLCFNDDSRSSSTDSCSSTSGRLVRTSKDEHNSNLELSCSSSESSNDSAGKTNIDNSERVHRRSTSSLRRALHNISISTRSLSCNNTPLKEPTKQKKTKKTPQRILRQPVSYTYLRGMSGLPTQRVPRSAVCCQYAHR